MTKRLELTVYETDDETGRYICADGVTYAAEAVDEFASWGRFSDAELAAEAYRQIGLGNEAMARFYKAILDGDDAAAGQQDAHVDRCVDRAQTLSRFATSPHYFEEVA